MPSYPAFVSSRVSSALRDRLEAFATSHGQSVQDVVVRAVIRLLDEEAREPPALATVLHTLRETEAALRQQGVSAIWVFGSVARGDADPDSYIDLAVEFEPDRRPTLFTLGHLQEQIERLVGTKVAIGLRRDLRPQVVPAFERDAVPAF